MPANRTRSPFPAAVLVVAFLLLPSACTSTSDDTSPEAIDRPSTSATSPTDTPSTSTTSVADTSTSTAAAAEIQPATFAGLELPSEIGTHFATSGTCALCHTQMFDDAGRDVSIDTMWRSTMMANAARDPYWQATVRAEVEKAPELAPVIEDKCSTCHMPMARTTASFSGESGAVLDDGYLDPGHELHTLAVDGVSCTVCHQIQDENLGTDESFSGGFLIDAGADIGERVAYGPFEVTMPAFRSMGNLSGFIPEQSSHIQDSAVCGTCHTLYTPFVDESGTVLGLFPEQMTFPELVEGAVDRSCQDCHMPLVNGETSVSTMHGTLRSKVNQHQFVGGNDYMLTIMSVFGEALELTASSDDVEATRARILTQLENDSISLGFGAPEWEGDVLTSTVLLGNATGHKLPTGFPSRRAWLHTTLTAADGSVVFESGAWTPDGAIIDNENDTDPAAYETHYDVITDPSEVQIYEAILVDSDGDVTTTLLRAAAYAKDNRLLPGAFDKATAPADIGVYGAALDDVNFAGTTDTVSYVIDTAGFAGPFTFTVEVLYQSIGYRWADNLRGSDGAEVERFVGYYDAVPNVPSVMATQTVEY